MPVLFFPQVDAYFVGLHGIAGIRIVMQDQMGGGKSVVQ